MASTSEILQSYWDMFAHRYTSEDKEYQKYVQRPADPPPILEGWSNSEPTISEILQKYEQMFAHRFTSKDEEYTKYIQRPADPPPVIEGWRNRSAGNQRHRERFRDSRQFTGRGNRYDHQGGSRSSHWQERGWGNTSQHHRHGQPSYFQHGHGPQYGSHFQGSQYGYY
ncbi:RNA guanine-N7 methyltransferase activating subunit [Varanus komodoensis]|uniref:RNMT-activating mini protein n=1 Tax=Varanus komodoensis TaxID=61221 RepID=A0A8D2LTE8_VARKO|nr:RNA guanine-N7 methyltransferase activating subunit [Varanus komodoensis]XP_044294782.1 RNA guanine-N7 methyltransferase activating subunit [Varanus komodoensis]XP_044294783.1 RNA guanine-N7 methyltransferase activating subunit [Varanus komodoensis]XP_044294784.1 RNA guanine-N7 methyltransferase activating subunit [Varanus komodoensis]XP_044294785.1 RNA guanine-N7 methyltransferase activating subunit [Varanus komodoensis]